MDSKSQITQSEPPTIPMETLMRRSNTVLKQLIGVVVCLLAPAVVNAQVTESWAAYYQGPGMGVDKPSSVVIDPSGNVIVTGYSMSGGYATEDFTTIKYTPPGDTLWLRRLDGTGSGTDDAHGVAVDAGGNIYVTGASWSSGSAYDYLTVKYDPSGDTLWTRRYNGPHNGGDIARAIVVDEPGNVYVTGESEGSIGTHGIFEDFATVKYSTEGDLLWVARYNGPAGDFDGAVDIVVDKSGFVYVTGTSDGGSSGSGMPYSIWPPSNMIRQDRSNGFNDTTVRGAETMRQSPSPWIPLDSCMSPVPRRVTFPIWTSPRSVTLLWVIPIGLPSTTEAQRTSMKRLTLRLAGPGLCLSQVEPTAAQARDLTA
jgi:hypothetical protein